MRRWTVVATSRAGRAMRWVVAAWGLAGGCIGFEVGAPAEIDFEFNAPVSGANPVVEGEPRFEAQPLFGGIPGRIGSHAGTITRLDSGELLAAWYSYAGPHELDGSAIYMSRLPAGAQSWTEPWLHVDRAEGDGNPVLYSEGARVWLFQAVVPAGWSTSHVEFQISQDEGRTWGSASQLGGPYGMNVRNRPVKLADGRLLLPAYGELIRASHFFVSSGGLEWTLLSSVVTASPASNLQPSVAMLDSGRLISLMRNSSGGFAWVAASDTAGASWSEPVNSGFPNADNALCLVSLGGGRLVLVFNDSPTQRRPLSAALSLDDGRTSPNKRVIDEGPLTYSYPAAVVDPAGDVHLVYSHDRERIQYAAFNAAWIAAIN